MGVGENIKNCLSQKGMTIKWLSEETGIPINTLYSITKRDSKKVRNDMLESISTTLGVKSYELMGVQGAKPVAPDDPGLPSNNPPGPLHDIEHEALKKGMNEDFERLNHKGQVEAAVRVNELTEIQRYKKEAADET